MKRFLLSFFAVLPLLCLFTNASAQSCFISDVVIQNVNVIDASGSDGKCTASFDASFTLANNSNNNYIFIQTYLKSATRDGQNVPGPNPSPYPNNFQCKDGVAGKTAPPRGKDVGTPLLNIVIDNTGATPVFTTYVLDPSVDTKGNVSTSTVQKEVLPNGNIRYTLTGIQIDMPYECSTNTEYTYVSSLFTTATSDATEVNCVNCALPTPIPSLEVSGITNCNVVTANFNNFSDKTQQLDYFLYSDVDQDGLLLPTTAGGADLLITSGKATIPKGQTKTINATLSNNFVGQDVFVAVNVDGANLVELLPTIECTAPLPVSLKLFNAKRMNTQVMLTWETAMENNNRGFSIQRNTGRGWSDVTFIESKANGGNSNALLTYEFNETNTEKNVTQYRLLQVDFDGKSKLSEIRSVRGLSQVSRNMIYPNPSNEGSINIIFDDEHGNRDVLISDMGGRIIKQYRNVGASTMRVDQLNPGMYSIRIVNQATGTQTNEKLVINK